MDKEVSEMLEKESISVVQDQEINSNKFETINQTYPLWALQNGRFPLCKIFAATKRLYLQTRLNPRNFKNLLKVFLLTLRILSIMIIIYLDDMLLLGKS